MATDFKVFKPVSAEANGAAYPIGSFPAPVADGESVEAAYSNYGVAYTSQVRPDGTVGQSLETDNAAISGTPSGAIVTGKYESTLSTYAAGDASILHFDSRGRLITTSIDLTSGNPTSITTEDSAAPANPIGGYTLSVYRSTLPTYTAGDASITHTDAKGRLLTTAINIATGESASVNTEDSVATTNPVGSYSFSVYRSTLPTYTAGDASITHTDAKGRLITTAVNATTGETADVSKDLDASPVTPVGTWTMARYDANLPAYTDGDAAIMHADSVGRLIVTQLDPATDTATNVSTEQAAGPTNPTGTWGMSLYRATLPTYTDLDAAVTHVTVKGESIVYLSGLATTNVSSVAANASSVTLLSANANRRGAVIFNDSATGTLYVKFGSTASTSSFTVKLGFGGSYELTRPVYTGIITGIWDVASGNARLTEMEF